MPEKYILNLRIALGAIQANKFRSLLTALGVIFGVAAVIAMLSIGNGAQQEILDQIKLVGVNNIVITPITEQSEGKVSKESEKGKKEKYSPGLGLKDAEGIADVIPTIDIISPEIIIETDIIREGIRRTGKLIGIESQFFQLTNLDISDGERFNERHLVWGEQVCIIGSDIKAKFFSHEEPVGKYIKCGHVWMQVVGVLKEINITEKAIENLSIRNYNMDIYTPLKTVLIRYKNRSKVTERAFRMGGGDEDEVNENEKKLNYHQLNRLVVSVKETAYLSSTAGIISKLLLRKHFGVTDFEITIPELLLKQQQRTKDIFNIVLGAIAGISLLIGGIGIMNIMLASVLERIKEIGIRLAIGARKEDIILQFLLEAVLISATGGIIGIILGVSMAYSVTKFSDIQTIISWPSIVISFSVAVAIGLIFGIAPAKKAAEQDPVVSLKHE